MDIRLGLFKELQRLADEFYKNGSLPEKTAATYLYLNIVEEITVYLIYEIQIQNNKQSEIKIKIDDKYLETLTIGQKLRLLKQFTFYNSDTIIKLLDEINKDRTKFIHKFLSCLENKEADLIINRLHKNYKQFQKEFANFLEYNSSNK